VVELDAAGQPREQTSPYSRPVSHRAYGTVGMLAKDGVELADEVANKVLRGADELAASRLFYEAHHVHQLSVAADALYASALLRYFLVIEKVAQVLSPKADRSLDVEGQAAIVEKLRQGLARHGTPKNRAAQIRNAANELDRLEIRHTSVRIERAAAHLGLDDSHRAAAQHLGKLRNTRLSHPDDGSVQLADLWPELQPARDAAKAFLTPGCGGISTMNSAALVAGIAQLVAVVAGVIELRAVRRRLTIWRDKAHIDVKTSERRTSWGQVQDVGPAIEGVLEVLGGWSGWRVIAVAGFGVNGAFTIVSAWS
jgi:hypothetical protein